MSAAIAAHAREAGPVPAEALDWFRRKGLRVGFDHRDVWREEHAYAFTAAKVMREDVLEAMRDEIARALEDGVPFEEFRKRIEPRLTALGWWGQQSVTDPVTGRTVTVDVPSRLHRIFETNMRTASAAGQWQRIERTKRLRPFLLYQLGPSLEHREEHVSWAGTVLPVDHPWWDTHFPPNGWGCKCRIVQLSERQLEALRKTGIRGPDGSMIPIRETAPEVKLVGYVNPRTGVAGASPAGIDPGWEYNFGKVRPAADGTPSPEGAPTPAERRRSQLEALGLPPDAIARDLAEMPPPPETTREGLRDWARDLRGVADKLSSATRPLTDDEARLLRTSVRRLMRAYAPDLASRDVERNSLRYTVLRKDLGPGVGAAHGWRGDLHLPPHTSKRVASMIRALAAGRQPTDDGWIGLKTLFHEELHGHSPIAGVGGHRAYAGTGVGIEEATVDTMARALVQRVFATNATGRRKVRPLTPRLGLPRVARDSSGSGVRLDAASSGGGSYQGWVNGLHVAAHRATGLTDEELTQRIVSALERAHFHADGGPLITDPNALADRVAAAIAPEATAAMRAQLRVVMLKVYEWLEAPGWR